MAVESRRTTGPLAIKDHRRLVADTPEAKEALKVASSLAERTGAGLRVFTVVAPRAEVFAPVTGRDGEEAFLATSREGAQAALDRALASMPKVPATGELLEGDVVDELAALDDREVDLLVWRVARLRPGAPRAARRRIQSPHPPCRVPRGRGAALC
jgi:nucleotide-binding universal stress UspA family protein